MLYAEIIASALSYSDRASDPEISNNIDNFLRIVEARVNRVLTTQKMSNVYQVQGVLNQEYYTLPTDYLSMRDIRIWDTVSKTTRRTLQYITPQVMDYKTQYPDGGFYYSIASGRLWISATIDATMFIELGYYSRLVPLSNSNTSNWLSINHPDCYVFGLLVEINAFVKDVEAATAWNKRFSDSLDEIDIQDSTSLVSGTPLQTRVG